MSNFYSKCFTLSALVIFLMGCTSASSLQNQSNPDTLALYKSCKKGLLTQGQEGQLCKIVFKAAGTGMYYGSYAGVLAVQDKIKLPSNDMTYYSDGFKKAFNCDLPDSAYVITSDNKEINAAAAYVFLIDTNKSLLNLPPEETIAPILKCAHSDH